MTEVEEKIITKYRIKESVIKEKLGLSGELVRMGLWRGLSPNQEEEGVSPDTSMWEFETVEVRFPTKDMETET